MATTPLVLQFTLAVIGRVNGTDPYNFTANLNQIQQQQYFDLSSGTTHTYTGSNVQIGDWISSSLQGHAYQIVDISSQSSTAIVCTISDISGQVRALTNDGNNYPINGKGYIFRLKDNLPVLAPASNAYADLGVQWQVDLISRYLYQFGINSSSGGGGAQGPQGEDGSSGPQGLAGTQGLVGNQGLAGTQGAQGSPGTNGTQGQQGWQGLQGWQGAQGYQGTTGPQGAEGTQGAHGNQGLQGVQGSQGWHGVQGVQGVQGLEGTQGAQGAQGEQGRQGSQGYQGAQGILGAQGTQGVQGAQGTLGAQGTQGPNGLSQYLTFAFTNPHAIPILPGHITIDDSGVLYNVYISYSDIRGDPTLGWLSTVSANLAASPTDPIRFTFVGNAVFNILTRTAASNIIFDVSYGVITNLTLTSFNGNFGNEDLVNASYSQLGGAGSQGVAGPQGLSGTQGPQGVEGPQGLSGPQGLKGDQGVQGVQGTQGLKGDQGTQGVQGVQGQIGQNGTGTTILTTISGDAYNPTPGSVLFPPSMTGAAVYSLERYGTLNQGFFFQAKIPVMSNVPLTSSLTIRLYGIANQQLVLTIKTDNTSEFQGSEAGSAFPPSPYPLSTTAGDSVSMFFDGSTIFVYRNSASVYSHPFSTYDGGYQMRITTAGAHDQPILLENIVYYATGPKGIAGTQGDQGAQGPQGLKGDQGFQGSQGLQGPQGDQGYQGAQGLKGDQGFQGANGQSSGLILFMNYSQLHSPDISGYKNLSTSESIVSETALTTTLLGSSSGTPVSEFVVSAADLSDIFVPAGFWDPSIFASATIANKIFIYTSLYLRLSDNSETLLVSSTNTLIDTVPGSVGESYFVSYTALPTGSSIVLKIFANNTDSGSQTLTTYYEGANRYSHIHTSLAVQAIVGPIGPQGPEGPQGLQGRQGFQGVSGSQGFQGAQGNEGVQGVAGSQGFQGISGPQGFQGAQGVAGSQGFQGAQGIEGPQGSQGIGGSQGAQGPQGIDGRYAPNYTRTWDASGAPDTIGYLSYVPYSPTTTYLDIYAFACSTTDASGKADSQWFLDISYVLPVVPVYLSVVDSNNNQGLYLILSVLDISNYSSAYNIYVQSISQSSNLAVSGPFKLTWFVGGVFGATGSTGSQGFQGMDGPQGLMGSQGPQGLDGTQGFQGLVGTQGPQGLSGVQGSQGPQGLDGTQGFQGLAGTQGSQGLSGVQGSQGPQGLDGTQGFQGLEGPQGIQGTQGRQGILGPQGSDGISSGLLLYLNYGITHIPDVSGAKSMSSVEVDTSAITLSTDISASTTNTLIATFAIGQSEINDIFIPSGLWDPQIFTNTLDTSGNVSIYVELIYRDASGDTLISSSSPQAVSTTIAQLGNSFYVPYTGLANGSYILLNIRANNAGPVSTTIYTIYQGRTNYSHIHTTLSIQIPTGPQGHAGNPGTQGPQGEAGSNGSQGAQGPSGPTGPAGPVTAFTFDGGSPVNNYSNGPAFDCGGVV